MNKQNRIKSNKLREEMFGSPTEVLKEQLGTGIIPTKSEILKEELNGSEISNSEIIQTSGK